MKKLLVFFGTRPETIKMAPLVLELRAQGFDVDIGLSGQHVDMVRPILDFFSLQEDFNLEISKHCKNVEDGLSVTLPRLTEELRKRKYDLMFVHGDTSSTLAGAMAGFYTSTPVAHVEAGLRSGSLQHPFPEEMNRKLTAPLTSFHFAPTDRAVMNLRGEGILEKYIHQTGNTVVDALRVAQQILMDKPQLSDAIARKFSFLHPEKKWILFTGHRRENLNDSLKEVLRNTLALAKEMDALVFFPMHPNPKIKELVSQIEAGDSHLYICDPVSYEEMIWLYSKISLIVTDSGGIQEEAASFGIPALVTRMVTERQESIDEGFSFLVGDRYEKILEIGRKCLTRNPINKNQPSPYGDGFACHRIGVLLQKNFAGQGAGTKGWVESLLARLKAALLQVA